MGRRDASHYDMLLRVRKRREEIKALALSNTIRQVQTAENHRDGLLQQRQRTIETAAGEARGAINPRRVQQYFQYERHLARLALEKDADLAQLRQKEGVQREELHGALKERRIVERLQARLLRAALAEQRRREQRISDEVAGNRAASARRAAGGVQHSDTRTRREGDAP
jgi:flagellar export protein FliJ